MFLVRAIRDQHLIVAGVAYAVFLLLKNADDGIHVAIHQQLFAFSLFIGEEAFFRVKADHHHVLPMEVFLISKEPALFHLAVHHFRIAWGHAAKDNVGKFVALVARGADWLGRVADMRQRLHYHIFHGWQVVFERHGIVISQRFASALFRAEAAKVKSRIKFEDKEIIDSELIQRILYVFFHPQQNGRHHNRYHGANHHAKHGKKRAHFMVAHCFQRHLHIFADQVRAHGLSLKSQGFNRIQL
jgi:hypothetical protein